MVSITADRRSEGSRLPNVHTFSLTSLFNLVLMQLAALCCSVLSLGWWWSKSPGSSYL